MYYNLIKIVIDHNMRVCLIRVKFDKKRLLVFHFVNDSYKVEYASVVKSLWCLSVVRKDVESRYKYQSGYRLVFSKTFC